MALSEFDITENLFQAIDTIVAERVKQLPYDMSQVVTIIENKNASAGIYKVSPDGQFVETVYSDNPTYQIGDKVYLLRAADAERRFILGLYLRPDGSRINRIFE